MCTYLNYFQFYGYDSEQFDDNSAEKGEQRGD